MPTRRMRFVGVSTGPSSIMAVFPTWSRILGLDAELVGLDIPIGAPPAAFRAALQEMRADPATVGALVTTHKISLLEATRDLFDELDPFATEVGEVSSIALRDGRTLGAAKDPVTAGLALEEVLSGDHFAGGGEVLCLGAGGAGTAIGWYLAQRSDAPTAMTFVDTDPTRVQHLHEVVAARSPRSRLRTTSGEGADVAALVQALPPRSLVINATGMGKDRPGSPLPPHALLPEEAVAWELNYRGTLEFLAQARAQQHTRGLTVVDGWRYFIHGWTQVISDVFQVPMGPDVVERLSEAAQEAR